MEQLSIRDWMVIIGAMMIAAVLIDAVRRYWRERRAEVRLNARIDRSAPLSDDDDAFNLLTELPNGGARIIRRDDLFEDGVPNPREALSDDAASDADDEVQSLQAPDPIDLAVEAIEAESASGWAIVARTPLPTRWGHARASLRVLRSMPTLQSR